jgi:hypothetical protein
MKKVRCHLNKNTHVQHVEWSLNLKETGKKISSMLNNDNVFDY